MCTSFVAKIVLSIVNTLIFIVGLVMVVIGGLIETQPSFSQKALSSLLDKLKSTASQAGVSIDTSDFSAADVLYSFTIALIVLGIFLAAVSLLGLIGVKYSLKVVLIVYFIITLVLFLAQVIIVLVIYIDRDVFDDTVKPRLTDTIKDSYKGIAGNDATSQIWNGIMAELECCGVDSFADFTGASVWNTTSGDSDGGTLKTPVFCCKTVTADFTCAETPTTTINNMDTGCYDKIWTYLMSNSGIVIGIAAGVLFGQLVILVLTCLLMNSMSKIDSIV